MYYFPGGGGGGGTLDFGRDARREDKNGIHKDQNWVKKYRASLKKGG